MILLLQFSQSAVAAVFIVLQKKKRAAWLINHILKVDRKLGNYLSDKKAAV
jgi:hemerythrin